MPLLACIADDFAGAAQLAAALAPAGVEVEQLTHAELRARAADGAWPEALVVAQDTRHIAAYQAVDQTLAAAALLVERGYRHFYFCIAPTFDSTDQGNIGMVVDGLLGELGASLALVCPAAPDDGFTVYRGHAYVGERLLSESVMRQHPLSPMTDANLPRVLQRQTARKVGLLPHDRLAAGLPAAQAALAALQAHGCSAVVADAIDAADLAAVAQLAAETTPPPLVVASSGLAAAYSRALAARAGA
jgi:uncharacterized protein YgbK (DUF1537 family)